MTISSCDAIHESNNDKRKLLIADYPEESKRGQWTSGYATGDRFDS